MIFCQMFSMNLDLLLLTDNFLKILKIKKEYKKNRIILT